MFSKTKMLLILFMILSLSYMPLFADYFTQKIIIDYKQAQLKYNTIAMGGCRLITGEENHITELYKSRLITELSSLDNVNVVNRKNMDKLLKEIELSQSGIMEEGDELKVGKMLKAKALLEILIAELKEGTEMSIHVTEIETGKIVFAKTYRDFETPQKVYSSVNQATSDNVNDQNQLEILHVTDSQKSKKLSYEHRKTLLKEESYLAYLQNDHPNLTPQEIQKIRLAKINYEKIVKHKPALVVFSVQFAPVHQHLKKHRPRVHTMILGHHKKVRVNHPNAIRHIKRYIKVFGPSILKHPALRQYVIKRSAGECTKLVQQAVKKHHLDAVGVSSASDRKIRPSKKKIHHQRRRK